MLQLKTSNHHHKFQRSQSDRAHLLQANACSMRISLCPPDAMLMQADCSQAWVPSACAAHTSHVLTRAIDEYATPFDRSQQGTLTRVAIARLISLAALSRFRIRPSRLGQREVDQDPEGWPKLVVPARHRYQGRQGRALRLFVSTDTALDIIGAHARCTSVHPCSHCEAAIAAFGAAGMRIGFASHRCFLRATRSGASFSNSGRSGSPQLSSAKEASSQVQQDRFLRARSRTSAAQSAACFRESRVSPRT